MPQWVIYAVIVVVVLPSLVARQLRQRELSLARIAVLPAAFVVVGFVADHELVHRLSSAPALAMVAAGLVVAGVTGVARAATMRVWRVGGTVLTKGNGLTVALWVATILVRVGEVAAAYALGIPEGAGVAMLFAAATFGAQGLALAWRGGLLSGGRLSGGRLSGGRLGARTAGPAGRPVDPMRERVG